MQELEISQESTPETPVLESAHVDVLMSRANRSRDGHQSRLDQRAGCFVLVPAYDLVRSKIADLESWSSTMAILNSAAAGRVVCIARLPVVALAWGLAVRSAGVGSRIADVALRESS